MNQKIASSFIYKSAIEILVVVELLFVTGLLFDWWDSHYDDDPSLSLNIFIFSPIVTSILAAVLFILFRRRFVELLVFSSVVTFIVTLAIYLMAYTAL